MLYIVGVTAVIFVFGGVELFGGERLIDFLTFRPELIMQGQLWRIITWVFIPPGLAGPGLGLIFTIIALMVSYMIGTTLEREWGTPKFNIFYLFGVVMHIVYALLLWFIWGARISLTPDFLNLSLFFAFAVLFPDFTFRLFFIIPVKVKWLALLSAGFYLYSIIIGVYAAIMSPFLLAGLFIAFEPLISVLNFLLICGDDLLSLIKPRRQNRNPQVVHFRQAAKKAKKELADKPYRHKCAVCGKTDTEYPDMDFRYCSQCSGYHCFCSEHINNHIHFE